MEEETFFNVSEYEFDPDRYDMKETRRNVRRFIEAYMLARKLGGGERLPVITSTFTVEAINFSTVFKSQTEDVAIYNLKNQEKYIRLHERLRIAIDCIDCPDAEKKLRRKEMFVRRYLRGEKRQKVMQAVYLSGSAYQREIRMAVIQFAKAADIAVLKPPKKPKNEAG
ncbi:ArpU family phage packaging/lysis transcriptional regulator [Listeria ilorinensis]|uniref:ArpU family phage packaging/lysis transcriptional regulator n=1 Tax=Listeria ilorinensis TaxID=2867439 RepID=UPI001EF6DA7A|nr:ArpU family phage packaging/lysis transcriptional regulator [Listeria ilorinensis]